MTSSSRTAACPDSLGGDLCAGYALLWGVFAFLTSYGYVTGEIWNWIVVVPALMAAGGLIALAALDLEYGSGVFHYGFYLVATARWPGWPSDTGFGTFPICRFHEHDPRHPRGGRAG